MGAFGSAQTVTLDGDALTWNSHYALFALDNADMQPIGIGSFSVQANGQTVLVLVSLPSDFTVTAPASQAGADDLALNVTGDVYVSVSANRPGTGDAQLKCHPLNTTHALLSCG